MDEPAFDSPLADSTRLQKCASPCVIVIFGGTGDLTARKLLPALYNLAKEGRLPSRFACVSFARRDKSDQEYRKEILEDLQHFSRTKPIDETLWETFSQQLFYCRGSFEEDAGYDTLSQYLDELEIRCQTRGNRLFYLATPPSYFITILDKLNSHGLISPEPQKKGTPWGRVVIEKPFGHDLQSAETLQQQVVRCLSEDKIFRIDHYLGKETVQNLLAFRFGNSIFETLWNNQHIQHIQITVAEDEGIGTRGKFFEETGQLRDIVQNHLMQLLSLVAMEPPTSFQADAIRSEKVKVMESVRPFSLDKVDEEIVRGQYGPGFIGKEAVKGYRQEDKVDSQSAVETYVALRLFIDNWRWSGVPFYLRAGKRLPKRTTEIAITFRDPPAMLFHSPSRKIDTNVLVIRVQPNEGISIKFNCKIPGLTGVLHPVKMDFQYNSYFGSSPPEAYERLLWDSMAGDATLFARYDEALASWRLFTPVLERWKENKPNHFPNYSAGLWGPKSAELLLERNGHRWRLL